MTDDTEDRMKTIILLAVKHLIPVDIQLFFAFLMNLCSKNDILNPPKQDIEDAKKLNGQIDVQKYDNYKQLMDKKYGKEQYIHNFMIWYPRTIKYLANNYIKTEYLPAMTAPLPTIIWWVRHVYPMSNKYVQKVLSIKQTPMISPTQVQGGVESHLRTFCDHTYVCLFLFM